MVVVVVVVVVVVAMIITIYDNSNHTSKLMVIVIVNAVVLVILNIAVTFVTGFAAGFLPLGLRSRRPAYLRPQRLRRRNVSRDAAGASVICHTKIPQTEILRV